MVLCVALRGREGLQGKFKDGFEGWSVDLDAGCIGCDVRLSFFFLECSRVEHWWISDDGVNPFTVLYGTTTGLHDSGSDIVAKLSSV